MLKHKLTLSLLFVLLSIALSPSVNALKLNNVIIKSGARIDKKAMDKKLNPYLGKETLKATPGVVVIDELDLSLHPTWQKRIVRILKELFPKVQFICATHSPFIIQSLEPGELITLDTILDEEYSGQSIEDIAEDIMNVPLVQYSEKKVKMYQAAKKYFEALKSASSDKDLEILKEKLDVLSAEYSDNPAYNAWMQQKYLEKKAEMVE